MPRAGQFKYPSRYRRGLSRTDTLARTHKHNFCSVDCHEDFLTRVNKTRANNGGVDGYHPLNTFLDKCERHNLCFQCGKFIEEGQYD